MNTFETAAVLKLVDNLTGPMNEMVGKVAGHESALGRHAARMGEIGQRMTMSVTLPVVAGLKEMADKAVAFSRIGNTMRGVLEQRARSVDNLTVSTKAYAAAQLEAVTAVALANQAAVLSVANRVDAHTATDEFVALSNSLQMETRGKEATRSGWMS